MTPDQFLSTMHRQRADQAALRLAMADLVKCLAPEQSAEWLSALQTRIAKARTTAQTLAPDQAAQKTGLLELATALDYLHRSLAQPAEPKTSVD